MLSNFKGQSYRLCDNWRSVISEENVPINYLEIGTFYGANLISVAKTYAKHKDSRLYCIDPGKIILNIQNTRGNSQIFIVHLLKILKTTI